MLDAPVRYIPVPTGNSALKMGVYSRCAVYPCTYRELWDNADDDDENRAVYPCTYRELGPMSN